jgi:hypothetical protein
LAKYNVLNQRRSKKDGSGGLPSVRNERIPIEKSAQNKQITLAIDPYLAGGF